MSRKKTHTDIANINSLFENYVLLSLILLIDIDLLSDIHEIWKLQNLREIHFYATSTATLWKYFFKNFAILVEGFCFQSAYYGITIVRGGTSVPDLRWEAMPSNLHVHVMYI